MVPANNGATSRYVPRQPVSRSPATMTAPSSMSATSSGQAVPVQPQVEYFDANGELVPIVNLGPDTDE
jgi:hypothetical protein